MCLVSAAFLAATPARRADQEMPACRRYPPPQNDDPGGAVSEGWPGGWFAGPGIVRHGSIFRMWYAGGDGNSLHYAESADGVTWTFGSHNPVLRPSPDPSAPDVSLGDSVSAYRDGDEFRILYGGFNFTQAARRCVCMATIAVTEREVASKAQ